MILNYKKSKKGLAAIKPYLLCEESSQSQSEKASTGEALSAGLVKLQL